METYPCAPQFSIAVRKDTLVAPYLVPCTVGSWACYNQNMDVATCCQQNFTLSDAIGTVIRQLSASTAASWARC